MNYLEKLRAVNAFQHTGYWGDRISAELQYLDGLSRCNGDRYNAAIEAAADQILTSAGRDGALTKQTALAAEEALQELAPVAKGYTLLFAAHAHIDMNWQWGYHETASLTVDTFRTMLDLMREYPEFTFGQSQASTYEIVEKFAPEMLPEIRQRIREGRWEVNAAEWVEPDKNMIDGESMTRQILQAKKYLSALLEIPPEELCVEYIPDTFGHAVTVPEVLAGAGVPYMYHCRGAVPAPHLYWYEAPSGKRVLTYLEQNWYNRDVSTEQIRLAPSFYAAEQVKTALSVYGVGDHGGGPSRRDIERIRDYASWPLTPTVRFGTMREFFHAVEREKTDFPVITEERNFIFTGCYTTESRLKMANRVGEVRLNETEALMAMATVFADDRTDVSVLDAPWRRVLFNQFHDILPGSGVVDTREYGMGQFQEAMATLLTTASRSMRAVAGSVDVTDVPFDTDPQSRSEGGGVGIGLEEADGYRFPAAERGNGKVRLLHLFNTTAHDREEVTELTVWDYPHPIEEAELIDVCGNAVPFAVYERKNAHWGHDYLRLLAKVRVPGCGYTSLILRPETADGHLIASPIGSLRTNVAGRTKTYTLENEKLRAVFDTETMHLISLTDKISGEELLKGRSCYFRLIDEMAPSDAWTSGNDTNAEDLNDTAQLRRCTCQQTALHSSISYELHFRESVLYAAVRLDAGSDTLTYSLKVVWNERARYEDSAPQLSFVVPVNYAVPEDAALCDIPYGTLIRKNKQHEFPVLRYMEIMGNSAHTVGLVTDCKYGFRLIDGVGSIVLIRNTTRPDPDSDHGIHYIRIGVICAASAEMKCRADCFTHPLAMTSGTAHTGGTLPPEQSLLTLTGEMELSCVKKAENGDGIAVRVYSRSSADGQGTLRFACPVREAFVTDMLEHPLSKASVSGRDVTFPLPHNAAVTLLLRL